MITDIANEWLFWEGTNMISSKVQTSCSHRSDKMWDAQACGADAGKIGDAVDYRLAPGYCWVPLMRMLGPAKSLWKHLKIFAYV
ncbi:hypothetical protein RRG08_014273 [Elysia crispata]|uniref:Uncharacterized protein n=1 Tax=Elysia crispata TaxID=231223 RepID=A0AAE1DJ10_9GAST|nr:hypothetical protein RRG08_014273 [Elysia crispata]